MITEENIQSSAIRQLNTIKKLYADEPHFMLEHYQLEKNTTYEYEGRELLELLQNADDAAESASDPKVFIHLEGNQLVIANTGQVFSNDGLKSIFHSHLSSKFNQKNQIGNKGLGFRTTLSWAERVSILSGDLKISFSNINSKNILDELIKSKPLIKELIWQKYSRMEDAISIFRCPEIIEKIDLILDLEGYDTAIILDLKNSIVVDGQMKTTIEVIEEQLSKNVHPEVLLFLNNLNEIKIKTPNINELITKEIISEENINDDFILKRISAGTNNLKNEWNIFTKKGNHQPVNGNNKNYELAIAWMDDLQGAKNVLHSYFKTEVVFNFPGILHGTFELSSNRNELIRGKGYNAFLFKEAADLISEVAQIIANKSSDHVSYLPLQIANVDFHNLNNLIKELSFDTSLLNSLKDKRVFPTINNEYVRWDEDETPPAFYEESVFSQYLDPHEYNYLLLPSDDEFIIGLLDKLEHSTYDIDEIIKSVAKSGKNIAVSEYARLIKAIEEYVDSNIDLQKTDGLFYDKFNNLLTFDSPIFLPTNGISYAVPEEIGVKIMDDELAQQLLICYNSHDYKNLTFQLEKYNIKEFNFNEVVESIISFYSAKQNLQIEEIKKMHHVIFSLYKSSSEHDKFWKGSTIKLISKKLSVLDPKELYFGKDYDNFLAEDLYHYKKDKIVAAMKVYEIDATEISDWKRYLEWLGIADLPRKLQVTAKQDYADYVMMNFNYRYDIGNYNFKGGYNEFKEELTGGYGPIYVQSVDDLEGILKNNTTESIINWIDKDLEMLSLLEKDIEGDSSLIYFNFYNTRNYRQINGKRMKSYLKWKLGYFSWLLTESQTKAEPSRCMTAAYINEDFKGLIEKPNIDYDKLKKLKVEKDKVDYILSQVGVHKSMSTLPPALIYSILNKLPEIHEIEKKAKTIYNQIAVNYDDISLTKLQNTERDTYIKTGKVYCKDGKFHSVEEVFYVNDRRYGEAVIRQFNTIDIERRRGKDKIRKIFAVKALDNLEFSTIGNPLVHPLSLKFEQEIESFKPYVYVLRKEQDNGNEKNIIKSTKFQLVSQLKAASKKGQHSKTFELNDFEYLYIRKRNMIYLKTPTHFDEIVDLKDDIHFCSAIAEIFSAIIDVDAPRLQIRELFSKSASVRDELLRSELDDDKLEKLKDARKKLGITSNPKIDFWSSFLKCFKGKKIILKDNTDNEILSTILTKFPNHSSIIKTSIDLINYLDYNDEDSLLIIVNLFKDLGITLEQFNKYHYPSIDLDLLYEIELKKIISDYSDSFKSLLYEKCRIGVLDKKDFLKLSDEYHSLKFENTSDVNFDILQDLKTAVKDRFDIDLNDLYITIDFNKLHFENKNSLWNFLNFENLDHKLFNQFLDDSQMQSLLLFDDEFSNIEEFLLGWLGRNQNGSDTPNPNSSKSFKVNFGNNQLFYDDFFDLRSQLDHLVTDDELSHVKLENIKISKKDISHGKRNSSGKNPPKGLSNKKPKEEIGFLGEYLVYKHLLKLSEDKSNVKWVSDYAKKCGVNLDGKDGWGYDIEYVPKGAKHKRFVEVKVVGWDDSFHITPTEVHAGERLKNNYEIFLVKNIDNLPSIKIEKIQGIFNYKGKSFSDNDMFTVVNDNFILKFKREI